ncbi:hypothetical protein [Streptomyces sp. NPDC093223]|uniref:hypothetical protein n=1 Tax=Streptomyces sp. NPDC093223 TaxID=3366033 RepID=UPI0037F5F5A9
MIDPTVILLAGGRELTEPGIVPATLYDLRVNVLDGPIIVRHGACPGETSADQAASDWINEIGWRYGITEDPMPADWDHCAPNCPTAPGHRRRKKPGDVAHPGLLPDYCPAAGPRRNHAMTIKAPQPTWALMFPEPGQPNYGTNNCARLAEAAGIPTKRITP